MAIRTYRCGASSAVYYAPPVVFRPGQTRPQVLVPRADTEPVRLRTRMHLAGALPGTHGFRVVARLADGDSALVCLGASRQEVIAAARPKVAGLARFAVSLRVQQWVGGLGSGRWQDLRPHRGELELPRRRMPRRRRERVPGDEE
jgi:hypothetical protein